MALKKLTFLSELDAMNFPMLEGVAALQCNDMDTVYF